MTTEATLDQWLKDEGIALEKLSKGPGPGLARPEQLAGKSGLAIMRAMMSGELPFAECAHTLNFCAIEADEGYALFQGTPTKGQLNPMGSVQGGWIGSIMDSALGCAVLTALPAGTVYTTTDLQMKFLKFLRLEKSGVTRVRAEARVSKIEGNEAFAQATLVGPDQTVLAEATAICRLKEIPAGARP